MPERITKAVIERALRQPGRVKIADTQRGLVIRTKSGDAIWSVRVQKSGKDTLLDLGSWKHLTADQARMLAAEASDLMRRGGTPDAEWVGKRRVVLGIDDELIAPSAKPLLGQIRRDFLAWIAENRRPATHKDYIQTLNQRVFDDVMRKPMDRLQREDLAEAVAKIADAGHAATAAKTARILSSMWRWATEDHRIRSTGAERGMLAGIKPPVTKRAVKAPPRIPTPAQVRGLLAVRSGMTPATADAVTLCIFTAQRRLTVVQARREHFVRRGQHLVWEIPVEFIKAHRPHFVSLPREIWHIVERVESGFLFPYAESHMSVHTLTHAFTKRVLGFSPHDIRRGFAKVVRSKKFRTADVKLVLDHAEGVEGDVTREHYDFAEDMAHRHAMIRAWSDALAVKAMRKAA